jgi:peptidoglycan-associated lipoprotein
MAAFFLLIAAATLSAEQARSDESQAGPRDRFAICAINPRCHRHREAPRPVERAPDPPMTMDAAPADAGDSYSAGSRPDSGEAFLQNVPADRVFFATASAALTDEDRATLDAQAAWLVRYPQVRITIEGHADERGSREANLALGDRRASAVRDYLAAHGVDAARMTTISWGKERPLNTGSGEEAWAQNRRAVTVVPN